MTFTKEQLINQAREEVAFWRERDELIPSQQTAIRLRLAEAALAALTEPKQEPVAWRYRYVHTPKSEEHGSYFTTDWVITHSEDECNPSDCFERQPLYAAPPAPRVPDGYALVPVEMTDEIGEVIAREARCCGGIALDIYDAILLAAAPQQEVK